MSEGLVSRGFRGRRRQAQDTRLPPGQYLVDGFLVLSAGPTPHTPLEEWNFSIIGEVEEPKRWTWEELRAALGECEHRHSLCHQVVEARYDLGGRLGRHPAQRSRDRSGARARLLQRWLRDESAPRVRNGWQGVGSVQRPDPGRPQPRALLSQPQGPQVPLAERRSLKTTRIGDEPDRRRGEPDVREP